MKDLEIAERAHIMSGAVQPHEMMDQNAGEKARNGKLKTELKSAYSEIASLKQTLAMRDRKINNLE